MERGFPSLNDISICMVYEFMSNPLVIILVFLHIYYHSWQALTVLYQLALLGG